MLFRKGNRNDVEQLRKLGLQSWLQYKDQLTKDNWNTLHNILKNKETYINLVEKSKCLVCENEHEEIIGMAFLVFRGNPTDIYDKDWCYIRFVSVNPKFRGNGIGEILTRKCIDLALKNNEQTVALHTSEIMPEARYIYEKLGFRILKELEPRLGVRYWLYTLDLTNYE